MHRNSSIHPAHICKELVIYWVLFPVMRIHSRWDIQDNGSHEWGRMYLNDDAMSACSFLFVLYVYVLVCAYVYVFVYACVCGGDLDVIPQKLLVLFWKTPLLLDLKLVSLGWLVSETRPSTVLTPQCWSDIHITRRPAFSLFSVDSGGLN